MQADLTSRRREALGLGFDSRKIQTKHPEQLVRFAILALVIGGLTAWIVRANPGALTPVASAALGFAYGSLGMFTHDLLHGGVWDPKGPVGRFVHRAMAFAGLFIFGLSPGLWLVWHNRVHHYRTNEPGADPDSFGLWEEFKSFPLASVLLKRAPGSKHWLAWLYLPLNFSNQVMNVAWYFLFKSPDPSFRKAARRTIVAETLLNYALWIAAFWAWGFWPAFWALLVPALFANLWLTAYILTQHLLCPLTPTNDPLENTLGVSTWPILDRLHFNFSHHVEHHYFPEMNSRYYPELREILRKAHPDRYRLMPHRRAIALLLATPRVYLDHATLFDPHRDERKRVVTETGRTAPP